jgi:hypothetical protein
LADKLYGLKAFDDSALSHFANSCSGEIFGNGATSSSAAIEPLPK